MFKAIRLLIVVFCIFFFSACLAGAEENKTDAAVIKLLQEKIAQAKKIEKTGLRTVKELAGEIAHSSLISASIQAQIMFLNRAISDKKMDKKEALSVSESVLNTLLSDRQGQTTVPIVERSFAYLVLRDISLLKGDRENAKSYTRKAFENLQDGIEYYSKIAESPIAMYNLFYFRHLAENVFKLGEASNLDDEKILQFLKGYSLIEERIYALSRAVTAWNKAVSKKQNK
jgi:hypothetical protein